MIYIPLVPSTFGVNDDKDDIGDSDSGSDDDMQINSTENGPYHLRERQQVDYSNLTKVDIDRKSDEPKLSIAIKYIDRKQWLTPI